MPPNTKTFTALIGTFAKCGPLESALDTIQNVIQQDGSGSAIGTYAALMSACEKAGQWDLAIALFDRMTALVRPYSLCAPLQCAWRIQAQDLAGLRMAAISLAP